MRRTTAGRKEVGPSAACPEPVGKPGVWLDMKRIRLAGALVASVLVACDLFTGYEDRIQGMVPFSPPEGYVAWWEATEACSELAGDFEAIEWFLASSITRNGSLAFGAWRPPHRIVIVRGYEDDAFTVRHEILHDLLSGDPDHRSSRWADCGLDSSARLTSGTKGPRVRPLTLPRDLPFDEGPS